MENSMGEMGIDQYLTPNTRINSEWMKELNIKKETINKLGEHRIVYLSDLWERKDFKTSKSQKKITKSKMNNFNYIKLKRFCTKKLMQPKLKGKK